MAGTTPRATIDAARDLLQRRCYRELLEALVDRDELKKIVSGQSIDDVVATFVDERKPEYLQSLLDEARKGTPRLDPAAHMATYETSAGTMRMHEVDGRWYITNR